MLSSRVMKRLVAVFLISFFFFPLGFFGWSSVISLMKAALFFRVCFHFGIWQRVLYTNILAHPILVYEPIFHHVTSFKQASCCNYKI